MAKAMEKLQALAEILNSEHLKGGCCKKRDYSFWIQFLNLFVLRKLLRVHVLRQYILK